MSPITAARAHPGRKSKSWPATVGTYGRKESFEDMLSAERPRLARLCAADLPVVEIASRQGISEGAVSLRLHRGRRALRHVLTAELRHEAVGFGLLERAEAEWQETRIWCSVCGRARLRIRREGAAEVVARCSHCSTQWSDRTARYLAEVKGPWRTLLRMNREAHRYFRDALQRREALCSCCGGPAEVLLSPPPGTRGHGVQIRCGTCGAISYQPSIGLVLTLPAVEAFWREQGRIRLGGEYELERDGRSAVVTTLQSVSGGSSLDVISDRATFDVFETRGEPRGEREIA